MNAIDLLKLQHDEVEEMLEKLQAAGENAVKTKEKLFAKVADALAIHATIEEEIFYPASKAASTEEFLHEAVVEHLGVKRLIADLLEVSPEDENFDAMIVVLAEQVIHHKTEEEDEYFPEVEKILDEDRLELLGQQMQARAKVLEEKGEPRKAVPKEVDKPAEI